MFIYVNIVGLCSNCMLNFLIYKVLDIATKDNLYLIEDYNELLLMEVMGRLKTDCKA
jgi:hypothetical protein